MINLHILQMQIFHELPWQPFFKNPCYFVKKEQKNICIFFFISHVKQKIKRLKLTIQHQGQWLKIYETYGLTNLLLAILIQRQTAK